VEPLAPHEKIFVDSEIAEDENHGELECQECHGGNPNEPDWTKAHNNLTKDPSSPGDSNVCGECHDTIADNYKTSLHASLSPMKMVIDLRADTQASVHGKVDAARESHCSSCHSSCGQCHISRPESVKGGLLEGHLFQKRPPMQQVCTACHGSRIGKEYLGKNKGFKPDIHKEKYFKCSKCHTADEMHGDGEEYTNRYEVKNGPQCLGCHQKIYDARAENAKNHWIHKDQVSCNVCHSQAYKNCYGCHVGKDKNGVNFYKTEKSNMQFKIGLNPLKSRDRPEAFVVVRRVPVDRDTFKFYVENGLKNFDRLPTWAMATPHNIRRQTPQNSECNACHGNAELFLSNTDVEKKYLNANKSVVVPMDRIPRIRQND
jgi:Cytochrome c554 and c-prime